MKIRLLSCVAINGKPTMPDTVVDLPARECASLIRRRMAEQAEDGPAPDEDRFLDATADTPPEPKRRRK